MCADHDLGSPQHSNTLKSSDIHAAMSNMHIGPWALSRGFARFPERSASCRPGFLAFEVGGDVMVHMQS